MARISYRLDSIDRIGTTFRLKRNEYVHNLARFDPDNCFVNWYWISASLVVSNASYRIDCCDTNNNLLRTIVGHTDKGVIDEKWDLKTTDGQIRDNYRFELKVYIWPNLANTNGLMNSNAIAGLKPYHLYLVHTPR